MYFQQYSFEGGISDNKYEGIRNSAATLENIDIHTNSRALRVTQALSDISGEIVTDLIVKFVKAGDYVFGFGDSGNIYKIDGSSVTKIYTDSNGEIIDATLFYGKLYWTTSSKLSRCDYTSNDWDTDTDHDWQTLNTEDYHPMYSVGNWLFIGDGRYIDTVNNTGAYVNEALDLHTDWTIRAINLIKPLLLIGAESYGRSKCFTWDFINNASSWEEISGLESGAITQLKDISGSVLAILGSKLYYYNGLGDSALYDFDENIPNGGITIKDKKIYLINKNGIYSYGRKNKNYSTVPCLEHSISDADTTGAIIGTSDDLYASYKDTSSNYYLVHPNTSQKASQGVIETLAFRSTGKLKINKINYYFDELPEDTSIQIKYKRAEDNSWKAINSPEADSAYITQTTGMTEDEVSVGSKPSKEVQFRIELNTNSNNTPVFNEIIATISELSL